MISLSLGVLLLTGLTVWMCWRIVEKAGWPGWWSLTHLLAFTGIGMIANLLFFWVLAFARWPRDDEYVAAMPRGAGPQPVPPYPPPHPTPAPSSAPPGPPPQLAPPPARLPAPAAGGQRWVLEGRLTDGRPGRLVVDDSRPMWLLGGTPGADLVVPDPSVGTPHARLLIAPGRLGLEDLGSEGGTWIDGVRLLPAHGPRDITQSQRLRFGVVELVLSRP